MTEHQEAEQIQMASFANKVRHAMAADASVVLCICNAQDVKLICGLDAGELHQARIVDALLQIAGDLLPKEMTITLDFWDGDQVTYPKAAHTKTISTVRG